MRRDPTYQEDLRELVKPSQDVVPDTGTWSIYVAMKDLKVGGECPAGTWDDAVKLCKAAGSFLGRSFEATKKGDSVWIARTH